MRCLPAIAACASLALGCSSVVVTGDASGASSSGSGGASATASATSGAGGGTSTGLFTTGAGGAGGGPLCNDPTVFFDIEGDGPLQHFEASCGPYGQLTWPGGAAAPGPPPPKTPPEPAKTYLTVAACSMTKGSAPLVLGAGLEMWPGTSMSSTAYYDRNGTPYQETPAMSGLVDVTTLGPVGGVIEGTFSVTVAPAAPGGTPIKLTGKFRVCRGPDIIPV